MLKKILTYIFFFIFYFNIGFAKIQNKIVLKVENEIITQHEVKNKILTELLLSGQKVTQENINNQKKNCSRETNTKQVNENRAFKI